MKSLKQRGDKYKQQLFASLKQTSDLRLESAERSRELRERVEMLEEKVRKSEAAKRRANSRLGGYKGHLKSKVTRDYGSSDSSLYPVSSYIGHLKPLPPFSYHSCTARQQKHEDEAGNFPNRDRPSEASHFEDDISLYLLP